eukprot:Awhi_evm2s1425
MNLANLKIGPISLGPTIGIYIKLETEIEGSLNITTKSGFEYPQQTFKLTASGKSSGALLDVSEVELEPTEIVLDANVMAQASAKFVVDLDLLGTNGVDGIGVRLMPDIDGNWTEWKLKEECISCNQSSIFERSCTNPPPFLHDVFGGKECEGEEEESRPCFCPIDGVWTDYLPDTDCSVTCGE